MVEEGESRISRRDTLKLVGSGATGILLTGDFMHPNKIRTTDCEDSLGGPGEEYKGQPWKIAVLPDTQKYAQHEAFQKYGEAQTEWIAENHEEENIKFVTQLGDLVHNGNNEAEWERINSMFEPLDEEEIPYSTVPGNHDWAVVGDKSSSITNYLEWFGEERFENHKWYGGAGPDDLSHYQTFSVDGNDFLHLGLEWEPRDKTLEWAEEVVETYDMPTIVTTHSYLEDGPWIPERIDQVTANYGNGNHGEYVFQNFISENDPIFGVFSGHVFRGHNPSEEGEYDQVSQNDYGNDVYEMLSNFQGRENGGDSKMRLVEFKPGEGSCEESPDRIDVKTYSPFHDEYDSDFRSEFSYELDFEERFPGYER